MSAQQAIVARGSTTEAPCADCTMLLVTETQLSSGPIQDYTAEAVESDLAVVVIVTRHPRVGLGEACTAVGARRTATATLVAPLGDRVVLDLQQGAPVSLVLAP